MSPARTSRSWSRTRASESGSRRNSYEPRRSIEQIPTTGHDRDEYQRFILTDPIAARYLEFDSCVTVLEQRREIVSYQAAIVEQWATSRNHPTFTITIHTGDTSDKIVARVLGIPKDESVWSVRLRIYFKALNHYHARRRDTPDGVLMITSLSGFPSSLTVILVPGGDVSKHYADFFVNEDLKRLGCSGRVGLSLFQPNNSTVAKYHQLYRTNDKNPLYSSVIELVRMCQIALHIFGVLDQEYIDGLLCDVTENAVSKWWRLYGMDVYNTSPHDGALGPTSVAALLGLLLGTRNRLNSLSLPVPKDPFDVKAMKKGILAFQKSQKMHRNGRLDELSLRKLFAVTEKAAHAEGVFRVPKAVKTTVAELSGKGEELAAEGGSRKGKAGIAEMETTEIDIFAQLAYGERCKWLWHGKALKKTKTVTHGEGTLDGILLSRGPAHDSGKKHVMQDGRSRTSLDGNWSDHADRSPRRSLEETAFARDHLGAAARRVHGVFDDGRAGLDRFIGVVNPMKRTTDAGAAERLSAGQQREAQARFRRPYMGRSQTSPTSPNKTLGSPLSETQNRSSTEISPIDINALNISRSSIVRERSPQAEAASKDLHEAIHTIRRQTSRVPDVSRHAEPDGRRRTVYHGVNLDEYLPVPPNPEQDVPPLLRRTQSLGALHIPQEFRGRIRHGRLSFSLAESGMVMSNGMLSTGDDEALEDDDAEYVRQRFVAEHLKSVRQALKDLSRHEATWTTVQMEKLETHVQQTSEDQEMLQMMLEAPSRAGHELQETATMVLQDGQGILNEGKRELESLAAKLDYELNILEGKIEDVERGVGELDRALQAAETRVDDVERDVLRGTSWVCVVM